MPLAILSASFARRRPHGNGLDAVDSDSSSRKGVKVQVLSSAFCSVTTYGERPRIGLASSTNIRRTSEAALVSRWSRIAGLSEGTRLTITTRIVNASERSWVPNALARRLRRLRRAAVWRGYTPLPPAGRARGSGDRQRGSCREAGTLIAYSSVASTGLFCRVLIRSMCLPTVQIECPTSRRFLNEQDLHFGCSPPRGEFSKSLA